jgi:GNAT superfamily N-acetyltransferase
MVPIHSLLAEAGNTSAPDDRAARSRFRRIVADLGAELYVATIDDHVVGVLHLTYARHLLDGQRATLELLVVRPAARRRGVGTALATLARARAGKRHCRALALGTEHLEAGGQAFLTHLGWHPGGERWQVEAAQRPGIR